MTNLKSFFVDIDNTICKTSGNDYHNSIPILEVIAEVNRLYDEGNYITYWTSRGSKSGKEWKEFTAKQLKSWGVKYNELRFDSKPDVLIDDKAITMLDYLSEKRNELDILSGIIADTLKIGTKVLVTGNGGLAATSSHFVAELVGKFAFEVYIPAISLCDCAPITTAVSNDMGFENVFAHQVKVLGNSNDVFIGLTTSKSKNIIKALCEARKKGLITVAICGKRYLELEADFVFSMNGNDTAEIQENTLKFLHKVAYKAKEKVVNAKV